MTDKTMQVVCAECGRPMGAYRPKGDTEPGAFPLRHKLEGDWCPGGSVRVAQVLEVEVASKAKRQPIGRDGADSQAVCWTCHQPIRAEYWRAIWPGFPPGAFVSICGPECPELGDAEPVEQVRLRGMA